MDELMKKFFKNYSHWCKFLGRTSNIRFVHFDAILIHFVLDFIIFVYKRILFFWTTPLYTQFHMFYTCGIIQIQLFQLSDNMYLLFRLPYVKLEAQQHKLLYVGLYLLIWGEAANLRFMPECLCFVFHHVRIV